MGTRGGATSWARDRTATVQAACPPARLHHFRTRLTHVSEDTALVATRLATPKFKWLQVEMEGSV